MNEFNLEQVQKTVSEWASRNSYVQKVYLFGSYATGKSFKTGRPPDSESDLDLAIQLAQNKIYETSYGVWVAQKEKWRQELCSLLNLAKDKLNLLRYPENKEYTGENLKLLFSCE